MSTLTRTPNAPSSAVRDARHRATVALLRRAGEQATLLRLSRAPFQAETAEDAARNRAMVAAGANASAWRYGQAWRPEDNFAGWTPERRQQQATVLARILAKRRELACG
jgi:hypothetical protein